MEQEMLWKIERMVLDIFEKLSEDFLALEKEGTLKTYLNFVCYLLETNLGIVFDEKEVSTIKSDDEFKAAVIRKLTAANKPVFADLLGKLRMSVGPILSDSSILFTG